ncbi:hypothetical protein TNCV_5092401 [Trichonephila clavipes]|nr:hypothetical protein TNCV_5092401 [Trichonephila clavipes]
MDGSEKITPLVIGKSAKPRCFKDVLKSQASTRRIWLMWTTHSLNLMLNQALPEQDLTFDDYVLVDTDINVWGALYDSEIVALDHNNTESDEDESEELTPVTLVRS